MEIIRSSEMSVHIRISRSCSPDDDNIHNYRCNNLKSYVILVWVVTELRLEFIPHLYTYMEASIHAGA
jgi:hypothetical protein